MEGESTMYMTSAGAVTCAAFSPVISRGFPLTVSCTDLSPAPPHSADKRLGSAGTHPTPSQTFSVCTSRGSRVFLRRPHRYCRVSVQTLYQRRNTHGLVFSHLRSWESWVTTSMAAMTGPRAVHSSHYKLATFLAGVIYVYLVLGKLGDHQYGRQYS